MGDSRKYPYHTTGGILEFQGRGGFLGLKFRRHKGGGGGVAQFGISKAWGRGLALNSVNFQREDSKSFA